MKVDALLGLAVAWIIVMTVLYFAVGVVLLDFAWGLHFLADSYAGITARLGAFVSGLLILRTMWSD